MLLRYFESGWLVRLHKISLEGVSGFGGSLPVFIVVMTKMAKIEGRPPVKVSASCDFFMNNLQDCKYIALPPESVWVLGCEGLSENNTTVYVCSSLPPSSLCPSFPPSVPLPPIRGVRVYGIGLKYMKNDTEFVVVPSLPPPSLSLPLSLPLPPSLAL